MIIQEIYIPKYNWNVKIYYAVNKYYKEEIIQDLVDIDCDYQSLQKVEQMLNDWNYNCGFTYSNNALHETVMVIGLTTSPSEFYNTLEHEKGHLVMHIAIANMLNPYGEAIQYAAGTISKKLFQVAMQFLCKHCRQELDLFAQ